MKRAIAPLCLLLLGSCASTDGFETDEVQKCGPGAPVGVEAGWDARSTMERGDDRLTLIVQVANNSDEDITVDFVRADPMVMDRDTMYEIEGGALDTATVIKEGDASTFELAMMGRRRMQNRGGGVRASGVDVAVTVVLEPKQSYRCLFRLPLGF
jgi:hypothetical protein